MIYVDVYLYYQNGAMLRREKCRKLKSIIISDNLCAISAALLGSSFAKEGDPTFTALSSEEEEALISQGILLAEKRAAIRSKQNDVPLQFCREDEAFIRLYGQL